MRHHFNIRGSAGLIRDEEGDEFATLDAARDEPRARDMMMDDLRGGGASRKLRIEIDHGAVLDSVGPSVTVS